MKKTCDTCGRETELIGELDDETTCDACINEEEESPEIRTLKTGNILVKFYNRAWHIGLTAEDGECIGEFSFPLEDSDLLDRFYNLICGISTQKEKEF